MTFSRKKLEYDVNKDPESKKIRYLDFNSLYPYIMK